LEDTNQYIPLIKIVNQRKSASEDTGS